MNAEEFRSFCLSKKGVTESLPFDDKVLVFKVGGKMFALINIEQGEFVNLKCDPERAIELREQYKAVRPGYHMSKTHWNSVYLDGSLTWEFVCQLTDHSYDLVFISLTKKVQAEVLAS